MGIFPLRSFAKTMAIMFLLIVSVYGSQRTNLIFFYRSIKLPTFENRAPIAMEADFADFLFANELYSDAADEYERVGILHPMDAAYDYATYQRALCFIYEKKFDRAEYVLDRLGYTALDREVSYSTSLLCALLEVAKNNPERGEFLLSDALRNLPEKAGEIKYWRGWMRLLSYDVDGALEDFSAVCNANSRNPYYSPRAYGIKRWLEMNRENIPEHSPYLARWLSGIVPGAGDVYLGDWHNGINALLINGAMGFLTIDALLAHRYLQSTAIFLLGWNRYYFGGMINSQNAAFRSNNKQWNKAILTLIDTFIGTGQDMIENFVDDKKLPQRKWLNGASITADIMLESYQNYITTQDAQQCQFEIGCSNFSRISFRTHNPIAAALMTSDRLQRCNPFAKKYYPANEEGFLMDTQWGP